MACDIPEPCKFSSLDEKRCLWTYKEVDLAPHLVVGLVLQVGNTKKFLRALGFESLDLLLLLLLLFFFFFRISLAILPGKAHIKFIQLL